MVISAPTTLSSTCAAEPDILAIRAHVSEPVEVVAQVAFTIHALGLSMDLSIAGVVHPVLDSGQVAGVNIKCVLCSSRYAFVFEKEENQFISLSS